MARQFEGVDTAHACLIGSEDHRTLALVFDGTGVAAADVRQWMVERLPRFMDPDHSSPRDGIQLSSAGKVEPEDGRRHCSRGTACCTRPVHAREYGERVHRPFRRDPVGAWCRRAGQPRAGIARLRGDFLAQLEATFGCEVELARAGSPLRR